MKATYLGGSFALILILIFLCPAPKIGGVSPMETV